MMLRFVPLALALSLVLGAAFLLTHSHIEIFPCTRDDFTYGAGRGGYGMQAPREAARCDLTFLAGKDPDRQNAKLTPGGRALAVAVAIALPAAIGFAIGRAIERRYASKR